MPIKAGTKWKCCIVYLDYFPFKSLFKWISSDDEEPVYIDDFVDR